MHRSGVDQSFLCRARSISDPSSRHHPIAMQPWPMLLASASTRSSALMFAIKVCARFTFWQQPEQILL